MSKSRPDRFDMWMLALFLFGVTALGVSHYFGSSTTEPSCQQCCCKETSR